MKSRASALPVAALAAAISLVIMAAAAAPCAAAGSVHVTGNLSGDYLRGTSAQTIIGTFAGPEQPRFAGVGWEVILGKVGFGGDYMASFLHSPDSQWWLDWYAQPLFLSFHPLRRGFVLDPFVQAGLGSAGRVLLHHWTGSPDSNLFLSIFPFVAGGLAVDLEGFLASAKVSYAPFMTPPPATTFENAPIGQIQVTLSVGIALDW
ncbi:MAG TPA: hypothetical protein VMV03_12125 [Spirochaetia bacterium]|nr:hypothetical protein [Spirochaetia bacterium]